MSTRGRKLSWVVVLVTTTFIAGYLVKYGGPSYARSAAPAPVLPVADVTPAPPPPTDTGDSGATCDDTAGAPGQAPSPAPPPAAPAKGPAPARTRPGPLVIAPAPAPKSAQPSREPPPVPGMDPSKAPPDAPRIKFDKPEHDFGTVYQEQTHKHDYAFTNVGKSPLKITNVVTTCGCAVGKVPDKEIAPGQGAVIPIILETGRLRNRITKHVYVTSNDPVTPRAVLTLTADVKLEADVIPSGIYFSRLLVGDKMERTLVIKPVEVKQLKLLKLESADPHIALTVPLEQLKPGVDGSYTLVFRIGPYSEPKLVDAKVKITTDCKHQTSLLIPFYGRVAAQEPPHAPPDVTKLAP